MIVIDCSILMAYSLPDENDRLADKVLQQLAEDKVQAIVPAIFFMECANVLLLAHRRKRINNEQWRDFLDSISLLPIEVDQYCARSDSVVELSEISENYGLTIYDAAYLELSRRKNIPLATLDKRLGKAASEAALPTFKEEMTS